jgi:hypothetical protein
MGPGVPGKEVILGPGVRGHDSLYTGPWSTHKQDTQGPSLSGQDDTLDDTSMISPWPRQTWTRGNPGPCPSGKSMLGRPACMDKVKM